MNNINEKKRNSEEMTNDVLENKGKTVLVAIGLAFYNPLGLIWFGKDLVDHKKKKIRNADTIPFPKNVKVQS